VYLMTMDSTIESGLGVPLKVINDHINAFVHGF
jgi:hypothetical protein